MPRPSDVTAARRLDRETRFKVSTQKNRAVVFALAVVGVALVLRLAGLFDAPYVYFFLGGGLAVTSAAGQGSTFTVTLPLAFRSARQDAEEEEQEIRRTMDNRETLVVEDNPQNLDRERFLAAGCDGYIAKPIDIAKFSGEVGKYLGSA